jgi:hypothetical protein
MHTLTLRLALAAAAAGALALIPLAATAASASASQAAGSAPPILRSMNWGGYITAAPAGKHVNSVSANWTVPTARPGHSVGKPPYQAAMWVGIDGSSHFGQKYGPFQCGVYETTSAKTRQPVYSLFWEMVPDGIQPLQDHGKTVHVKPGDHILAMVHYGIQPQYPATYHKFTFTVVVNGAWHSTLPKAPGKRWRVDRHTAEVMSESPTFGHTSQIPGMLDMGTVHYFYAAYAWDDNTVHPVTATAMELWHGTKPVLQVTRPATTPGYQHGPDKFATLVTGQW